MLRRSVSQIFISPTPQQEYLERLQAEEAQKNVSLIQNLRPMSPLSGQQTSMAQSTAAYITSSPSSSDMTTPLFGASPPASELSLQQRQLQMAAIASTQRREVVLDAATRHPVFFTERLKRPPHGVIAGEAVSPVAEGYIFNDGGRRWGGVEVKL